ncbi:flavin-containing monooxygenase [Rhodococcus sp. LB1]|uniref:flavin-containing monooxygenase n=1 Tax=Rhodococcus sp. LB1 TaxID=1807499 RepID=UPI0007C82A38|nr:NAD(P)/FAD-dependent oxidoreductase [Rhodococcus sp. LB1]
MNTVDYDAVVVGAGAGGIYAVHKLTQEGLRVIAFEGAPEVGGVWYHNRYPGARVDIESYFYCFPDEDLYPKWTWKERYPAQPEILAYLNFAADTWGVREHIRFSTWVTGAQWEPAANRYRVTTSDGQSITGRYLVMASGQLSKARTPSFPGLENFRGRWVQTSHWPTDPVETAGKRIAVIGTGSSGVQAVPALAHDAESVTVFQRTANYSVPAQNVPLDQQKYSDYAGRVAELRETILHHPTGSDIPLGAGSAHDFTPEEQQTLLRERWARGGHTMNAVFSDQGTDIHANTIVADFVRERVREIVRDPDTAELLTPRAYPIGSRRLCVDTGYYEAFNRSNVHLVDVNNDPIQHITPDGIRTRDHDFEFDLIVFALGFSAFTGALDEANIRNEFGEQPTDRWERGPRTLLGLMTRGFPNLFLLTGPGSPSVLANMILDNVQHVDFVADLLQHMNERGYTRVEPETHAQDEWTAHVAEAASHLLRLNVENYMVHVNRDDGSRVFMPYVGGLDRYVDTCDKIAADDFTGFTFH